MIKGKYIGRHRPLFHKTALLREVDGDSKSVFAQFDDMTLPIMYTHSWKKYRTSSFIILRTNPND